MRYFNSKEDCHAAKEQERRLATTSIYGMYGRESGNEYVQIISIQSSCRQVVNVV